MLHFDCSRFSEEAFPFDMQINPIYEDFPVHTHDFTELVVITNGRATHQIDNESYEIHTGDVYLLNKRIRHGFTHVNNLALCNIMFQPEKLLLPMFDLRQIEGFHSFFVFEPYFRKSHKFRNKLRLDPERLKKVEEYIHEIHMEFISKPEGFRNRIVLLLNDLIIYLSRKYHQQYTEPAGEIGKLSSVITHMERNYLKQIRLEELAEMAHLSERQFSRIFQHNFNQTPIDFLINMRISHACRLLTDTSMNIKQIAYETGFSDPNYFSRVFRKKHKISPVEYRNRNR